MAVVLIEHPLGRAGPVRNDRGGATGLDLVGDCGVAQLVRSQVAEAEVLGSAKSSAASSWVTTLIISAPKSYASRRRPEPLGSEAVTATKVDADLGGAVGLVVELAPLFG
jgi:hypothetical protein